MKKKKLKFAVLIKDGCCFRVTEITRDFKSFGDDQWVVIADGFKKNDFLSHKEMENQIIVHRPLSGL